MVVLNLMGQRLFLFAFFCTSCFASLLELGIPVRYIEASGQKVPIYAQVKAKLPKNVVAGAKDVLYLTGAGIRVKPFIFFDVNAYVISSFVDSLEPLGNDPWPSLNKSKVKALHLHFLRNASASRVRSSFVDSLKANQIDMESPLIKEALERLDYDMEVGKNMTLLAYPLTDGTEVILFESPKGIFSSVGKNVAEIFWKIWFGVPADRGMERLKPVLCGAAASG